MRAITLVFTVFGIGIDLSEQLSCIETTHLSLSGATITKNNLGGFPEPDDDPVMIFENVGNYRGTDVDLVVSVKDGSDYVPRNSDSNGMLCGSDDNNFIMCDINHTGGHFGQINLLGGESTTIVFTFYKHGSYSTNVSEPIVLDGFKASFYDIDQGGWLNERFVVKGWQTAMYNGATDEALFSETEYDCADVGENCLFAASTQVGKGCDNPTDPMELGLVHCKNNSVDQLARSFQVDFVYKSSYELAFKVEHREDPSKGTGRNVVFAFESSWEYECDNHIDPREFLLDDLLCEEEF